jgi:hypothetical protein
MFPASGNRNGRRRLRHPDGLRSCADRRGEPSASLREGPSDPRTMKQIRATMGKRAEGRRCR